MRTLVALMLTLVAATWAHSEFDNPCYQCNAYNDYGQGFMAHPNKTMCCYYYECWKTDSATTLDSILRTCPPGTWYDEPAGGDGAPCAAYKPYTECVSVCGESQVVTPGMCHLYPNPGNTQQFGTLNPPPDGPWEYQGECKANFVFDHSSCTCIPLQPESCFCMANILLDTNVMDHSCHNGHVDNSVDAVTITTAPSLPSGMAGFFNGLAYLVMPMFSGLQVGCHVGCMSFGAFFNTEDITKTYQPVFGTDQCGAVGGFGMYLRNNILYADVGGWTSAGVTVVSDQWYYASIVYKSRRRKPAKIKFYLMTVSEAVECATNCNCPDPVEPVASIYGSCVIARSCGLAVGMGDRDDLGGIWLFSGRISKVQVSHKCHAMACDGDHCKAKRRG